MAVNACVDDTEDFSQYDTQFLITRHDGTCNQTHDEPYNDHADDTHGACSKKVNKKVRLADLIGFFNPLHHRVLAGHSPEILGFLTFGALSQRDAFASSWRHGRIRVKPPSEGMIWLMGTHRSEARRVGKECASTCRSRWSRYH